MDIPSAVAGARYPNECNDALYMSWMQQRAIMNGLIGGRVARQHWDYFCMMWLAISWAAIVGRP